jgi:hypothetical protein
VFEQKERKCDGRKRGVRHVSGDQSKAIPRSFSSRDIRAEKSIVITIVEPTSVTIHVLQLFNGTHTKKATRALNTALHHRLGSDTHILFI